MNENQLGLAQYYMVEWTHDQSFQVTKRTGNMLNMSMVSLQFTFQRRTGFFLLQIYIPLTLIVMCSWVTFWLVKTDKGGEIPARTNLGATTVLTVVTIGFGGKSKPQVKQCMILLLKAYICIERSFLTSEKFHLV